MSKIGFFSFFAGLLVFLIGVLGSAFLTAAYLSIVVVFMYAILTVVGIVPPQPIL